MKTAGESLVEKNFSDEMISLKALSFKYNLFLIVCRGLGTLGESRG